MWLVRDSFPLAPSPGLKPSLNAEAIVWDTASGTYCLPNVEALLAKVLSNDSAFCCKPLY